VLAGHVDSRRAPAVFFRLRELNPGDEVWVRGADGRTVEYSVERSGNYAKTDFPTAEVYGPTERPTLRLVTCSGRFDRSRRSYDENLVVYATAKA
jgi:sortase (surface protein transpeptidase)